MKTLYENFMEQGKEAGIPEVQLHFMWEWLWHFSEETKRSAMED